MGLQLAGRYGTYQFFSHLTRFCSRTFIPIEYPELKTSAGQNTDKDLVLEFFFHGRGVPEQKTTLGMFRSLLWQLCNAEPSIKSQVASIFAQKTETQGKVNEDWDWHVEEVRRIFTKSLGEVASKRKVMLFVDGLDEAGTEDARNLANYFNDLSTELLSKDASAKICISCRHYPVLNTKVSLEIYVEEENRQDIKIYVHNNIATRVQDESIHGLPKDFELISEEISRRAAVIFQWG